MEINRHASMTDALRDLYNRGFTDSFGADDGGLRSMATGKVVRPEEVTIVEYHRFEGETDPDDMAVVYAVECSGGLRGTIVDAYGTYASQTVADFLKGVRIKKGL